jgi:hypothetical protein
MSKFSKNFSRGRSTSWNEKNILSSLVVTVFGQFAVNFNSIPDRILNAEKSTMSNTENTHPRMDKKTIQFFIHLSQRRASTRK